MVGLACTDRSENHVTVMCYSPCLHKVFTNTGWLSTDKTKLCAVPKGAEQLRGLKNKTKKNLEAIKISNWQTVQGIDMSIYFLKAISAMLSTIHK